MKHRQQGFSIVELIVAIVIAGIVIPAIAMGLSNLSAVNHRARDQALSNMLAQNKVESLRSIGFNAIPLSTVSFTNELPSVMGSPKSASYTVSSPQNGIKQVDVTINYTDYGQSRSASFRSYISELGVGQ